MVSLDTKHTYAKCKVFVTIRAQENEQQERIEKSLLSAEFTKVKIWTSKKTSRTLAKKNVFSKGSKTNVRRTRNEKKNSLRPADFYKNVEDRISNAYVALF